jgi:hypothetical protein
MDWQQILSIIVPIIGAVYAFYHITEKRMDRLEDSMIRMDEKWERLFERLLIQDQKK